ncbi:hypothetical protein ACMD2_11470 [Ananas comosus]|uniref:Uncharacterized protein n=1 Tax=Ananas comosus TaxID=4615 RepID=A0A199VWH3_ANACO|nr:hypothetical protein ACMD2_11470 [Ananas comosus]
MFVGEDEEWLQILASVERLSFDRCPTMKSFPTWLHGLTSLQYLSIKKCLEINSLPEKGLPPSLRELSFHECHPMLKEQLEKLKAENSRIYIITSVERIRKHSIPLQLILLSSNPNML